MSIIGTAQNSTLTGGRIDVRLGTDNTDVPEKELEKWFTIESPAFLNCVCPYTREHVHATFIHGCYIIVWPAKDDPNILAYAADLQNEIECRGDNYPVKIVEYESALGPCMSWYQLAETPI